MPLFSAILPKLNLRFLYVLADSFLSSCKWTFSIL